MSWSHIKPLEARAQLLTVTMKTGLFILLATYLALHPGAALQCYSCTAQVSNSDCLNVQNCTDDQNSCWTSRVRAIGLVRVISKGCSSKCEDQSENYYVGKKNITCCYSDLCNVSAAHTLKPATTLGLLTVLCSLVLWGSSHQ